MFVILRSILNISIHSSDDKARVYLTSPSSFHALSFDSTMSALVALHFTQARRVSKNANVATRGARITRRDWDASVAIIFFVMPVAALLNVSTARNLSVKTVVPG